MRRRNPRPYRAVDRRKLAMDIIEREARAAPMSSQTAMAGIRDRQWEPEPPKPKR